MIRAKKHLGQHFLKDRNIAKKIVSSLSGEKRYKYVLEIGPGTGVLSEFLINNNSDCWYIEIDKESVEYLRKRFPEIKKRIIQQDFLKLPINDFFKEKFAVIGNFPYNLSSQIFFKILDHRDLIPEIVCMVQKEVAERIAATPGNKTYGKLSVLLRTFYDINYLFTVEPHVFRPPPKVRSAVIRLTRNERDKLPCKDKFFFQLVKQSFQNRRKTLRNALKGINLPEEILPDPLLSKRAEQLDENDFMGLCQKIEKFWSNQISY